MVCQWIYTLKSAPVSKPRLKSLRSCVRVVFVKKRSQPRKMPKEWIDEFEAAQRRPLALRFKNAFIHTYKPVLDDAPYRSFKTMKDYRRWCEKNLPKWLGYGKNL